MAFADDFGVGLANEGLERPIAPPFMADCQVRYSLSEDGQVSENPPSPSQGEITLFCEGSEQSGINAYHEAAWRHFESRAADYESALRTLLWKTAFANYEQASAEGGEEFAALARKQDFTKAESLDSQIALAAIFLYGTGPESRGYISFEFETGWDEEHGVSVIMHGVEVKGVSGRSDFTCRGDPAGHIAFCTPPGA